MRSGGCFCGAIRYVVKTEALHSTLCHCSDCRRAAGVPAVAWFTVAIEDFEITSGSPRRFGSSPQVTRGFCGDCGTGLTFQHAGLAGEIDVTTCSLDAPEGVALEGHGWTVDRLPWIKLADGQPEYPAEIPIVR